MTEPPVLDLSLTLRQARAQFEAAYMRAQLARCGGNVSRAARETGMDRSAFHRKLRGLGVIEDGRAGA